MASMVKEEPFPTDYEIAQQVDKDHITDVVERIGLTADDLDLHGDYTAKLTFDAIERIRASNREDGKVISVTGMTPTPMARARR